MDTEVVAPEVTQVIIQEHQQQQEHAQEIVGNVNGEVGNVGLSSLSISPNTNNNVVTYTNTLDTPMVHLQEDALAVLKRDREETSYDVDEVLKKAKLTEGGDSLQNVGGGTLANCYATTGNLKSPVFPQIQTLTPEWLLKRVWLKVNGELEASVWAGVISKDMGIGLRKEIRNYLEGAGKVPQTGRINLKATIMQAYEYTAACQKDNPMLVITHDVTREGKPSKKEGKKERDFMISLTPYGHSICVNELKLRKRDRFARTSTELQKDAVSLIPNMGVPPQLAPSSPQSISTPIDIVPKESEGELEKRESQIRDQNSRLEFLSQQLERKEIENAQLRTWMEQYNKPTFAQPAHDSLMATSDAIISNNANSVAVQDQQQQQAQQIYQNTTPIPSTTQQQI